MVISGQLHSLSTFTLRKNACYHSIKDWLFERSWRKEKSFACARNLTMDCPVCTIVVTLPVLTLFLGDGRFLCNDDTCIAY
jgi:hypothetical protein